MRIKADENIPGSGVDLLKQHGHDVMTVREEGLSGVADEVVFQACKAEDRTLITLDRDFGQVLRFPPQHTAGIVVLELGAPASPGLLRDRLRGFLALAEARSVRGELWIVEPGRVRLHLRRGEEQA